MSGPPSLITEVSTPAARECNADVWNRLLDAELFACRISDHQTQVLPELRRLELWTACAVTEHRNEKLVSPSTTLLALPQTSQTTAKYSPKKLVTVIQSVLHEVDLPCENAAAIC
jgi:hypothetical protein